MLRLSPRLSRQILFLACALPASMGTRAQEAISRTAAVDVPSARDPQVDAALAEGRRMVSFREFQFALDDFRKAVKLSHGSDPVALKALFDLQLRMGKFKDGVDTSTFMLAAAKTPAAQSDAETSRAHALYSQAGDKGHSDLLERAQTALKAALIDNPKNADALFLDGHVLARMGQQTPAAEAFRQCVRCLSPRDPMYVRAQHFAADPSLSMARMAPAVVVNALDGSHFNLDEMGGRVILIDFWATWCAPCNEELPHLKKIAREFAGQPLVILSVSWDADEGKWKEFVAKHDMTWVQYRDADRALSHAFGVEAIPHYFTIDADGALSAEMLGSGSDVEGKLKKLLARSRTAAPPRSVAGD